MEVIQKAISKKAEESVQEFDKELDIVVSKLSTEGWTLPAELNIYAVKTIANTNKLDDINAFLKWFFTIEDFQKTKDMVNGIKASPIKEGLKNLTDQCWQAFQNKLYAVCATSLLSVIEGILSEFSDDKQDVRMMKVCQKKVDTFPSTGSTIQKHVWISYNNFIRNLYQKSDFSADEPETINRHWLLHGRCDKKVVNGKPAVFYGIEKAAKVAETEEGTKTLAEKTVYATNVEAVDLTGTKAAIHYPSKETGGEVTMEVTIPIAGEHNVYNALAAVSVARELGLTCDEMKRGIESVQTIGGRSNLIHKNGITIIDDCYNANPVSMKASIDVLSNAPGRKIAVLGDMGELGAEEKQLHYMVGEHFAGKGIDALYCVGTLSQEITKAVRANSSATEVHHYEDKADLIKDLVKEVKSGDTVLVKASHFMGFPEIVKELTK